MKILGFAGSNSKNSINKQLVIHTLSFFKESENEIIDLNDYEVTIFSVDKQEADGIPEKIKILADKIDNADLLVISLAEHNGSYSTAFKNIYDWLSVMSKRKPLGNKKLVLMASSPGERGGKTVLDAAISRFSRDGNEIVKTFSFPSFHENFKNGEIVNDELKNRFLDFIENIKSQIM